MIGMAHGHGRNAMLLGARNRFLSAKRRHHLPHRLMAINDGQCACIQRDARAGLCITDTRLQTRDIPRQAQNAMGLMPAKIGLHQRVGTKMRIVGRETGLFIGSCGKAQKFGGIDFGQSGHGFLKRHFQRILPIHTHLTSALPKPQGTPLIRLIKKVWGG